MKKNWIAIGLLIFIFLFFTPMWAINKLDRTKTDKVINNHAHNLLYMMREHKKMQIDIARLIQENHKLECKIERYKAIIGSFERIVKKRYPNFIKEEKTKCYQQQKR